MNLVKRIVNGVVVEHIIDGVDVLAGGIPPTPISDGRKPRPRLPKPWPIALLPLKLLAKEGDRGAGDIIARTIGPIGGDAFKSWYKRIFGKDCGCGNRQEDWNARWPLGAGLNC